MLLFSYLACSAPPTVAYATVATGNTTLGAAMNYKCDMGFELNGTSASVTCGQDGNWTAVEFQCLGGENFWAQSLH